MLAAGAFSFQGIDFTLTRILLREYTLV